MRLAFAIGLFCAASPALSDPLDNYVAGLEAIDERRYAAHENAMAACSVETAEQVELREIALASPYRIGDCVTLTGVAEISPGYTFVYPAPIFIYYSDREEAWRERLGPSASANPFRVGIERNDFDHPDENDRLYEINLTGVVKDCSTLAEFSGRRNDARNLAATGPNDPIILSLISGFCHMHYAPVIDPVHMAFGDEILAPRLLDVDGSPRVRSLWRLPEEWPATSALSAGASEFFDAIITGSADGVSRTLMQDSELRRILEDRPEIVGMLRASRASGEIAILGKSETEFRGEPLILVDQPLYAMACMCVTEDCSGRWPISITDARANPERPYVCMQMNIVRDDDGEETVQAFSIPSSDWLSPFYEPGTLPD